MKIGLTANRWHAHAIAITTNTRNHAAHQMLGFGMINRPKSQCVQIGDRARAHREDVTHDPANAGCCTLIGLNKAGMVMAFHFENCRKRFFPLARTNIDNACIFAGPANHPRGRCGEFFQMAARRFVRAMLRPHHGKNAELQIIWCPAQMTLNAIIFFLGQAVALNGSRCNLSHGYAVFAGGAGKHAIKSRAVRMHALTRLTSRFEAFCPSQTTPVCVNRQIFGSLCKAPRVPFLN